MLSLKRLKILMLPLLIWFIVTAPLLLDGCSSVTVKDEIIFGNKGSLGAVQLHTLTGGQQDLTYTQWQALLLTHPMICEDVSTFGDFKKFYEQACSVCNCCTYDTDKAVDTFMAKVNAVRVKNK